LATVSEREEEGEEEVKEEEENGSRNIRRRDRRAKKRTLLSPEERLTVKQANLFKERFNSLMMHLRGLKRNKEALRKEVYRARREDEEERRSDELQRLKLEELNEQYIQGLMEKEKEKAREEREKEKAREEKETEKTREEKEKKACSPFSEHCYEEEVIMIRGASGEEDGRGSKILIEGKEAGSTNTWRTYFIDEGIE
jgi:hypothetical protein